MWPQPCRNAANATAVFFAIRGLPTRSFHSLWLALWSLSVSRFGQFRNMADPVKNIKLKMYLEPISKIRLEFRTRRGSVKKRSIHVVCEYFEAFHNAAMDTKIVFEIGSINVVGIERDRLDGFLNSMLSLFYSVIHVTIYGMIIYHSHCLHKSITNGCTNKLKPSFL